MQRNDNFLLPQILKCVLNTHTFFISKLLYMFFFNNKKIKNSKLIEKDWACKGIYC